MADLSTCLLARARACAPACLPDCLPTFHLPAPRPATASAPTGADGKPKSTDTSKYLIDGALRTSWLVRNGCGVDAMDAMDGWMDGLMDGWMDEWIDEWMD